MSGQVIPDSNHVSRYCKPSVVENNLPIVGAFLPRPNEEYLSVNWLEYLATRDLDGAIKEVRARFQGRGYRLRLSGRFVILNVGYCKESATRIRRKVQFERRPLEDDDSHAAVLGIREDDFALATEFTRLVGRRDVYPAVT